MTTQRRLNNLKHDSAQVNLNQQHLFHNAKKKKQFHPMFSLEIKEVPA